MKFIIHPYNKYLIFWIVVIWLILILYNDFLDYRFWWMINSWYDHSTIDNIVTHDKRIQLRDGENRIQSGEIAILPIYRQWKDYLEPNMNIAVSGYITIAYVQQQYGIQRWIHWRDILFELSCMRSGCQKNKLLLSYVYDIIELITSKSLYTYQPLVFLPTSFKKKSHQKGATIESDVYTSIKQRKKYINTIRNTPNFQEDWEFSQNRFNISALIYTISHYSHNDDFVKQNIKPLWIKNESGFLYPYPHYIWANPKIISQTWYLILQAQSDVSIFVSTLSGKIYENEWIRQNFRDYYLQ